MPLRLSKWRIVFVALVILSLFSWGGLIWFMRAPALQTHTPVVTKSNTATIAIEASMPLLTDVSVPTPIPGIGSTMTGVDGAILVFVPEGEFMMGSDVDINEQPIHNVRLDAFWIDQTEVTNKLFSAFVDGTGNKTDAETAGWAYVWDGFNWAQTAGANWRHPNGAGSDISGKENHPVVQISWHDALAYCEWAGRRLPTEAEWEKAARGTDQRTYPWGNEEPNEDLLNFLGKIGDTTEVGSYPNGVSPYGAYDMSGNVWEWTTDWYQDIYYATLEDHVFNPQGPEYGDGKVIRGGSWINFYDFVRAAERRWSNPLFAFSNYGFRCAKSHP